MSETLLVYGRREGGLGGWRLLGGDGVAAGGEDASTAPRDARRTVLAVPGEETALHWLELGPELSRAQAAAAARLMVAARCADPIADMHVAVGPAEEGRRCVALMRAERVAEWIEAARAAGFDPDAVVPDPLLVPAAGERWVRHDEDGMALVRGPGAAFAIEVEVAELVHGRAEPIGAEDYEGGLEAAVAALPVDLRQGVFGKKRSWGLDWGLARRLMLLGIAIVLATLAIQLMTILRYTAAADRLEEEAQALTGGGDLGQRLSDLRGGGAGFGATASALFAALQATSGAELGLLIWEPDGSLRASVNADSAATLGSLRERIAVRGFSVHVGPARTAGGRQAADFTMRRS